MNNNDIREEGSWALADAVQSSNNTIREVDLENNDGIDDEAMSTLSQKLRDNNRVEDILADIIAADRPDLTIDSAIVSRPRLSLAARLGWHLPRRETAQLCERRRLGSSIERAVKPPGAKFGVGNILARVRRIWQNAAAAAEKEEATAVAVESSSWPSAEAIADAQNAGLEYAARSKTGKKKHHNLAAEASTEQLHQQILTAAAQFYISV